MLVDARPALRALILSNPDIAALVADRVFPVVLPQGEIRDSIVYHRITETEIYHYRGPSWLMQTRFQIDSLSRSTDGAAHLADLVHETISGFAGDITFGGSPGDVCTVQGVFHSNLSSEAFDAATKLYSMGRDFFLWHNERN
jgi:hypothetical protein